MKVWYVISCVHAASCRCVASGHRVDSAEGLPALLRECLDSPGVHLIDCPVDYADNDRILNKEIRELSAAL